MEKVIFEKEVLDYFDDLVFALFKEEYFGFPESAQNYVDKIVVFIISDISSFPHKKTPKLLQYLGSNYIFYKPNAETTWYIFFEKRNQNYLITGIVNNYSAEAKGL
ncbi:hypothetical protein [Flavobacterium tructae]|uniref:Type II toxin-antitoxin system RelE/ParE family toxin n=1 Tax=Flavobacterium tructae TaxID=1114873 RepID=A0A1S1IXZ7_9FLAO|nr:hypothetical protein [Flavobacterium tructae]OHT43242.1 hypothetical protein BHE19_18230 [Flavobacterium tructae]OXB19877.1 hypothetical protein B0A71_10620 [Flavobacterium tructae]